MAAIGRRGWKSLGTTTSLRASDIYRYVKLIVQRFSIDVIDNFNDEDKSDEKLSNRVTSNYVNYRKLTFS